MENPFDKSIKEIDAPVFEAIQNELARQRNTLEMIASENFVPLSVLEAQGSVLTNKYAEGYPGKRYYGGCEFVDVVESLAIERAKDLFGAEHANVQSHSGASANAAVLHAIAKPGDKILGLSLAHGGHLTHGMKLSFSGRFYQALAYGVDPNTFLIDMDQVRDIALKERPSVIIAGWSAYSRHIDFQAFRDIADEVGAKLWTDMAHFAGLVAAGLHPSPIPYSDVVSSTIHKTLGGPRSGFLLCKKDVAKKIDSAVFPGEQGGPLMHVIAGKAIAFKIARSEWFKDKQVRTLEGAKIIAEALSSPDAKDAGINLLTGGTDVHLVLVDLRKTGITGVEAQELLESANVTTNKNAIPFDPLPPAITSGVRIGTPALATRGFGKDEFLQVGKIIKELLINGKAADIASARAQVRTLTEKFPLYASLG